MTRWLGIENTTVEADEKEDEIEFLTISLFFVTLILSQLVAYGSRKLDQSLIPEAGLLLILGMIVGACIRVTEKHNADADVVKSVKQLTEFDTNLFFVILLPPIIFDSGFTIRHGLFFGNIGLILSLAIFGTIIATFITGGILYAFSGMDGVYSADILECLIFGSLISATDPVTVIAVFNRIGVKAGLLIVVFGESVLNDAVALVLYKSMVLFEVDDSESLDGANALKASISFVVVFLGSVGVGLLVGFFSALLFKVLDFYHHDMRHLESTLVLLFPYVSYTLADGFGMSGIVSILFTGIAMSSYTRPNLSPETSHFLAETFSVIAHMAETFIFIYLGMAVFTGDSDRSTQAISFGFIGLFACLIARAVAVIPICMISNLSRRPGFKFSWSEIFVLWFSGLRGGMAYAISAHSADELDSSSAGEISNTGKVFQTATIIIVFATVFLFGGTVRIVCEKLDLIEKGTGSPLPSPLGNVPKVSHGKGNNGARVEFQDVDLGAIGGNAIRPAGGRVETDQRRRREGCWERIDRSYLSPCLIRPDANSTSVANSEEDFFDDDDFSANPTTLTTRAAEMVSLDPIDLRRGVSETTVRIQ